MDHWALFLFAFAAVVIHAWLCRREDPHWYLFCSLLLALVRTDGSLVGQAAYARSSHPGVKGEQKRRLDKLREAWALPPTDAELREMARARF